MRVLADFHHAGLLQSLILLFEKRLGGQVYRPIGTDWHTKGFWKVYDHPATVAQFLEAGGNTPDGTAKLNELIGSEWVGAANEVEGGYRHPIYWKCQDIDSGTFNRAISLQGFFDTKFDIVIASIPAHIEPFKRLCELHPSKPKLIFQIGNAWTTEAGSAPNIMASAKITGVPADTNFIEYHQEFDTSIFSPFSRAYTGMGFVAGADDKTVASFVNVFNNMGHFESDWGLFQAVKRLMPDWTFKSYGGQCPDGALGPAPVLAEAMRNQMFIWHTKAGGDGYGHIIHNAAAVGRPMIVKKSYYVGKMAEPLLIDGETCINIDGMDPHEVIEKILHYSEPDRWKTMTVKTYENFKKVVDFDAEAEKLKVFISNLK